MLHASRSLLSLLAVLAVTAVAFPQGSLTPPGAPAPTMKSLSDLDATLAAINAKAEKRTLVSAATTPGDASATFIISQPGSYYFGGNLTGDPGKGGIVISAPNVTIDLNGFTLFASAGSLNGITTSLALNQIVVRNGNVFGAWAIGIRLTATNSAILDVRSNGTTDEGIRILGSGGVIERCQVSGAGGHGIAAATDLSIVRDCTVLGVSRSTTTTLFGIIGASIVNCTVSTVTNTNAGGGTVYGIFGATISQCRVFNVTGASGTAFLYSGTVVDHCVANNSAGSSASTLYGISAREASHCHVYWLTPTAASPQCVGITAPKVSDCVVERVQAGAASTYGIRGGTTDPAGETGLYLRNVVAGVSGTGIGVLGNAIVEGNRVSGTTLGIQISSGVVRGNYTHDNATGIALNLGVATGNTSFNDPTAFSFAAGVRAGLIVVGGGAGGFDATANIDL